MLFESHLFYGLVALLGAMVGSFLNVVIHRLPTMLMRKWRLECQQFLGLTTEEFQESYSLMRPGSHCPACHTRIAWRHNIPILSFLWLRGRAACCRARISCRYVGIECLTLVLSLATAHQMGPTWMLLPTLCFIWGLIVLAFIDLKHQFLPDEITLPLLWLGLLTHMEHHLDEKLIGAAAGYLSLWGITRLYQCLTRKVAMGEGDFKLLAMLGAWIGYWLLPHILLIATTLGSLVGLTLIALRRHRTSDPIPFAPYLVTGGLVAFFFPHIGTWF